MATEKWTLTSDTGTLECVRDLAQGSGCVACFRAFVQSLLSFFVTQSRVLSKIGGEIGQGRPNTIAIHQVHCQGECDPLVRSLSKAPFGYC